MTTILIIFCVSAVISFISGVLLDKKKTNSPIVTLVGFISFVLSMCSLICFIIGHYITSSL